MSNDKKEKNNIYMKQYCAENKERKVKQIMNRQTPFRNSETFIEANRKKMVEELNSCKRKYLQMATLENTVST